ncbi:MAG: plasmid mobilization relaxosome protein MobC [Lachnospiraceae bacterium]|nr:plasmid mobilization relaxosome protein MobC [Lachnospiraceae bacterium]
MRKYKQVKEKKVTYPIEEWKEVERRASALSMKTGTFIRQISVNGKITYYNLQNVSPLMNALRIIGGNINQIAKKANETNSIYAGDINTLKGEYENLCHMLNQFLSTLPSTEV